MKTWFHIFHSFFCQLITSFRIHIILWRFILISNNLLRLPWLSLPGKWIFNQWLVLVLKDGFPKLTKVWVVNVLIVNVHTETNPWFMTSLTISYVDGLFFSWWNYAIFVTTLSAFLIMCLNDFTWSIFLTTNRIWVRFRCTWLFTFFLWWSLTIKFLLI